MKLKPKITMGEPTACLYKRFNPIQNSTTTNSCYKTTDLKYWLFDGAKALFIEIDVDETAPSHPTIINVVANSIYTYKYVAQNLRFKYNATDHEWEQVSTGSGFPLSSHKIAGYDLSKYYYDKTFIYVKKGSIESQKLQYLKGNKVLSTTMEITHTNDYLNATPDDLVIISKRLYVIDSISVDHVHCPKDYSIYTMSLTAII